MKKLSWRYLAGLIDGEGCIDVQVTKRKESGTFNIRPRLRIGLAEVGFDVIDILRNNYGGYVTYRTPVNSKWSPSATWELPGYKANTVLRNVRNSLIIKKEQARFCLWMEENIKGKQVGQEVLNACRDELKLMKRDSHRLSEKAQSRISAMIEML